MSKQRKEKRCSLLEPKTNNQVVKRNSIGKCSNQSTNTSQSLNLHNREQRKGVVHLSEKIPLKEDYNPPEYEERLTCYNCEKFANGIREIGDGGRTKFTKKFWWLCPDCFKKLILGAKRKEKERVEFT